MNNPVLNKIMIYIILVIGLVLMFYIGIFVLGLIMPFLIGLIIAVIANPVVKILKNKIRIPKELSSLIGILVVYSLLVLIIYLLYVLIKGQYFNLTNILKNIYDNFIIMSKNFYNTLRTSYPNLIKDNFETFSSKLIPNASSLILGRSSNLSLYILSFAKGIPSKIIFVVITILSSFYISVEYDRTRLWIKRQIKKRDWSHNTFISVTKSAKIGLASWFKAQMIMVLIVSIIASIVFGLLGFKYFYVIAIALAIFDALPIFGSGAVLWPMSIYHFVYANYTAAIAVLILYVAVIAIRQYVEPRFIGKQIGINPLITLFAIYVGFRLMGIIGILLSIFVLIIVSGIINGKRNIEEQEIQ